MGAPEESEEEKRQRRRAMRRARADRIEQNQQFLTDRTQFLIRQFGGRQGGGGGGSRRPGGFGEFFLGPAMNLIMRRRAARTGARPESFSSGLFG